MKKKIVFDFSSGKVLGGIALIIFGIILIVENPEALPFSCILFIVAILLICTEIKIPTLKKQCIQKCKNLISVYDNRIAFGVVSCKDIITKKIEKMSFKNENVENIDKTCNLLLANISFDLLSSGNYHIYYGELNNTGVAPSLKTVYLKSIQWLYENKYLTDDEYKNSIDNLNYNIKKVG